MYGLLPVTAIVVFESLMYRPVRIFVACVCVCVVEQGSRKFRQELGRAVQVQSKIDPDTDAFRDVVETAMQFMPDEALDEPVGETPDSALGIVE